MLQKNNQKAARKASPGRTHFFFEFRPFDIALDLFDFVHLKNLLDFLPYICYNQGSRGKAPGRLFGLWIAFAVVGGTLSFFIRV